MVVRAHHFYPILFIPFGLLFFSPPHPAPALFPTQPRFPQCSNLPPILSVTVCARALFAYIFLPRTETPAHTLRRVNPLPSRPSLETLEGLPDKQWRKNALPAVQQTVTIVHWLLDLMQAMCTRTMSTHFEGRALCSTRMEAATLVEITAPPSPPLSRSRSLMDFNNPPVTPRCSCLLPALRFC